MKSKLKILIPLVIVIAMIGIGDTLAYGKDQKFIDINHNIPVYQNGYITKKDNIKSRKNFTMEEAYINIKRQLGQDMNYTSNGKLSYEGNQPYYIITCKNKTKEGLNIFRYKVFQNKIERY